MSILLKDERVNQEIREELKRLMETNENGYTTIQNLWDAAKAVLRGKYISIQASIQKLERTQIQKLTLHLKELEKKQQINPMPSRRRHTRSTFKSRGLGDVYKRQLVGCSLTSTCLNFFQISSCDWVQAVSYTHLTLPTTRLRCRSRWSPYH